MFKGVKTYMYECGSIGTDPNNNFRTGTGVSQYLSVSPATWNELWKHGIPGGVPCGSPVSPQTNVLYTLSTYSQNQVFGAILT